MDHEEMRAAYERAMGLLRSGLWPVVEEKTPRMVTPDGAAEKQVRLVLGRPSWGSE